MISNLVLVFNASLSAFSASPVSANVNPVSERTEALIASEIAPGAHSKRVTRLSEPMSLVDNYFMDADGNWTDTSCTFYYDEDWVNYNCYAYAIPRYDLVPEYYPPEYVPFGNPTKWYIPGQFAQNYYYASPATAQDIAERVCEDFEALGFSNISSTRLPAVLPALGENEELIAVRVGFDDSHFMHYCKEDGFWYHKADYSGILKYKYPLTESRVWYRESVGSRGAYTNFEFYYSGDIWLVRYTPITLTPAIGVVDSEYVFCNNYGDRVIALDVDSPSNLEVSFTNINGFTAVLYSSDWVAIDSVTYDPIRVSVNPGRYYIVMKSYRYSDYIGVHASLSPLNRGLPADRDNLIVVGENDRIVQAKVSDGDVDVSAIYGWLSEGVEAIGGDGL